MRKFTFAKTTPNGETFSAVEFDSFDEAIKAVEKAIDYRQVEINKNAAPKESTPVTGSGLAGAVNKTGKV